MLIRTLPWEYAVRNLFRRPLRTSLTCAGLSLVVVLVLVVVGFIRGLEKSLAVSGDPRTAIVFSLGMGENLEYSSIGMRSSDLLAASVPAIERRYGQNCVSPELYSGCEIQIPSLSLPAMGLVRGVTPSIIQVRRQVELEEGAWPQVGEVIIGRLAATKLGLSRSALRLGDTLQFEGRQWRISGIFSAGGSAFESEIWCRLDELQQAMKRQDLSLIAATLAGGGDFADVDLFCKERLDLELQAMRETDYYASLQRDYQPIRSLAWLLVILIAGAGGFAGLNTMYGSVMGRIPELATLQTIGFLRRAIALSLIQEGMLLAATACLIGTAAAFVFVQGAALRFTMGAVALQIDETTIVLGCGIGMLIGLAGAIPPAFRALRMPVAAALRAV